MTPEFVIGDLVEYVIYVEPTDSWKEHPVTAVITGFYDQDTQEDLGNDYTTHDRVIYANITTHRGDFSALLTELELLSSVPRC